MARFLKVGTAATIKAGPFVDTADGYTAKTALTIAQADIRLSKNGGAFAQTHNSAGATHDENGYYGVPLDTTDTNTVGRLKVAFNKSGALPVWEEFLVLPARVYDALVGGSNALSVDTTSMGGTATTLSYLLDFANFTGQLTSARFADSTITNSVLATDAIDNRVIAANAIGAAEIATGAIDADALAADAVDEIWAKTMTELSAVPGVTASVLSALTWLFELERNRRTSDSSLERIYKDDGTTVMATSSHSDNGTTFTRGEWF